MTVLASDDFNAGDSSNLGANWTDLTAGWHRQGGVAVAGTGAVETYYSAVTWPNDHYSQCVVGSVIPSSTDEGVGPAVRVQPGGNLYLFQGGQSESRVYKRVGGSYTQLGSDGPAVAQGDVLRFEIQGTTLVAKLNGTPVCGSPISDSAIASGNAGLWNGSGTASTVDNWEGGDFEGGGGGAALSIAGIIQNYRNMGLMQ